MPKAKNIFKINVIDEDQDAPENMDMSSITDKQSVEHKTVLKKIKKQAPPKPVSSKKVKPLIKSAKTVKTKKEIKTVKPKNPEKNINKNIIAKPKNTEAAFKELEERSPVKRAIMESGKLAENKSKVLSAIENIKATEPKIETKEAQNKAAVKSPEAKTFNTVRDIISESLQEKEKKSADIPLTSQLKPQRSIKLYRKIAFSFAILTVILLSIVAYFMFVKVTIALIPNQERMSNNLIVDIRDMDKTANSSENSLKGAVTLLEMEQKGIYTASGTEVIGEEVTGKVTIINNYTKNQPLVASTRLIPPSGDKLYRLKNTVNVPAGGSVEAEIYADDATANSAIEGPSKFTFPGLWAGLQDKIYAESDASITYKQKLKRNITQADLDLALQDLRQKITDNAKTQANNNYKNYSQILYKLDENSIKSKVDGEVGDETENFNAEMQANVIAVAFNGSDVAAIAKQKFISSLPDNKEMMSFDESNIVYALNNYNYADGIATINVTFEGKTTLKENSNIIEIDKILGLSNKELDAYLSSLPDVAGYEVVYYPSFIKRVPNLVDRINIEIKK